jgi:hypothetical protein
MSLKVSLPGKFSHLPINRDPSDPDGQTKVGTATAIQQLLNKVQQKATSKHAKAENDIAHLKTQREHSFLPHDSEPLFKTVRQQSDRREHYGVQQSNSNSRLSANNG